jgi:hypothetical protein
MFRLIRSVTLVVSSVLSAVDGSLSSSYTWTDETDGTPEFIFHSILVRFTSNFVHLPPLPRLPKRMSCFGMTWIFSFKIFNLTGTDEIPPLHLSGEMPRDSKGLEEGDIESPAETCTDRHRMCETRARRPGHPCPAGVCGSSPIFYHAAPINRRSEMPEFQSYYNASGTNVTQPNKWKYSRWWRSCSVKSAGRCRQMWARGVKRTVSGVLTNTTTRDTRWKLYVVVSGRKHTVTGYVRW